MSNRKGKYLRRIKKEEVPVFYPPEKEISVWVASITFLLGVIIVFVAALR